MDETEKLEVYYKSAVAMEGLAIGMRLKRSVTTLVFKH